MTNAEIKANRQKWYDELMSGNHEQTAGVLHDKNGKCCLGVACHVAFNEGIIKKSWKPDHRTGCNSYDGLTSALPLSAVHWLGFDSCDPQTTEIGDNHLYTFSELNDVAKKDFEEIAAILKRDFIDPLEEEDDK